MSRELLDGITPDERLMLALIDRTALHIELTDGVFRLLYRAHTAANVTQPEPVTVARLNPSRQAEADPKAVSISEAMHTIEGMWAS